MKTKTIKTKETRWALSGEPISIDEFKAGIKEAEKGSFMTLDDLKKRVEEWKALVADRWCFGSDRRADRLRPVLSAPIQNHDKF